MAAGVLELTDANFEAEVLNAKGLVLVDFWAPWCGPCLRMGPVVEQLAAENAGHLKVAKVNVDESMGAAEQFGAMSIPLFVLFKNGQEVHRQVGAVPKGALQQMIDRYKG